MAKYAMVFNSRVRTGPQQIVTGKRTTAVIGRAHMGVLLEQVARPRTEYAPGERPQGNVRLITTLQEHALGALQITNKAGSVTMVSPPH